MHVKVLLLSRGRGRAAWPQLCSVCMTCRMAGNAHEGLGSCQQHLAGGRVSGAKVLLVAPRGVHKRLLQFIVQRLQVPCLQLHLRAHSISQQKPHSRMVAGFFRPMAGASTAYVPFQFLVCHARTSDVAPHALDGAELHKAV